MYLKFGQIKGFFYCFFFKMGLIGAYPPWKILDAITLTLVTMVTYTNKLGWKHCKAGILGISYSFSIGVCPSFQNIPKFLVSNILADGLGSWGYN